jgi:hypothetical protein
MGQHNAPKRFNMQKAFLTVAGTAVAAGALLANASAAGATPSPDLPGIINVFGQSAQRSQATDPSEWNNMIARERGTLEYDPDASEKYRQFLHNFDSFEYEPIDQKAADVNRFVHNSIMPVRNPGGMATPIETFLNGQGDCQDIAALEEDVMRYLGTDADQMLVARVNAEGDAAAGADFTVLLVNKTPDAATPQFLVMSNFPQIVPTDNNDVIGQTWLVNHHPANFAFVDGRNLDTYWKPKSGPGMS